jgi:multidrug efflux pump subunit AcrA (membrane-fusion protein)
VETIVDNHGRRLFPGDAVGLKLFGRERTRALTVPTSAIVYRAIPTGGPSSRQEATLWLAIGAGSVGQVSYTCVMHPEVHSNRPGKCPKCGMDLVPEKAGGGKKAAQVAVTLGVSDGERTEVISGLRAGDRVVIRGMESLRRGDPVYPVPWSPAGPVTMPPAPKL